MLPTNVRRTSPFLVERDAYLISVGFHLSTNDTVGGEGWLRYSNEALGFVVELHTNSGVRLGGRHLGYGAPAWDALTEAIR